MKLDKIEVPVPVGYDTVMRSTYGDTYMTPIFFAAHDYPFYKSMKENLKDHLKDHPEDLPLVERFL